MASNRRIVELSTIIQEQTLRIDSFLESKGLPSPSTAPDASITIDLPEELLLARDAVIDATDELHTIMLGPSQFITSITASLHAVVNALYRYDFASSFPVGSTASFKQISSHVGLNLDDTRRFLRVAMTYHIFTEVSSGVVAHTAISATIQRTPLLRQFMGLVSEETWRATIHVVDAIRRWPESEHSAETGYNIAMHTDLPFFDVLKADPERARRFDLAMSFTHAGGGFERAILLDMFDWPQHEGAVVVDLGGSHAHMCIDLARHFPGLKFVNQDTPEVIEAVAPLPQDVRDRVELMVHDFFTPQPVKGADVYLFRWIFHDWPGSKAVQILQALIPALKKGARIVIGDVCLPEPGTIPMYAERRLRSFDLHMKAIFNGKERDANEWAALFDRIDPQMKFLGVRRHPKSRWAVMEAVWEGNGMDLASEITNCS